MSESNGSLFWKSLRDGSYSPQFLAYYYKQWNNYQMSFHQHPSTEIMYLISGGCTVDVISDTGEDCSYPLKRGELIMLDANVPHRLIVEDGKPCRMLNVEFSFTEYKGVAPSIGSLAREESALSEFLQSPFSSMILSDPEEIYYVLKSLVLELDQQQGEKEGSMIHLLFCELLLRISRLRKEQLQISQQPSQLYVRRCIEFMHQNYDCNIQVKDIAAVVNLHPGYLHRIFRACTGRTLADYLNMLRMEKAKMLLGNSDIPVTEIADFVGISSRQYFHLLFKKYTNQTPVEYRNAVERHASRYNEDGVEEKSEDF